MLIRIILFIIAIGMIIRTSGNIRGRNVRLWETFLWLLVWAFLGIVAIVPDITTYIANIVGVGRGVDLAIYLAVIVLFYLMFKMYVRFERLEKDITKIVRKIAVENPKIKDKDSDK